MTDSHTQALSPVKRALLKIQSLRDELDAARTAGREPIAVVGIGCRLPGGVDSPERLWHLLTSETDAIRETPRDRWSDAIYDPEPGKPGKTNSRHGGFIDDVDRFDPEFFGISPREARLIDPQQRLLLEVAWHAIEDARLTRARLQASRTGVFVGMCSDDYARISESAWSGDSAIAYTGLGTARSIAAGRIAYLFGWHGPAIQVDTSCSSSLTAIHLACQSLRNAECDIAIAGGVNLILSPETTIALSELQALSPDGRCKTFDAKANGYVRGEGCGLLVLMKLKDAEASSRPIKAVLRASAINHDGRSNGMTAPNGTAQREVIRDALARAGVTPSDVDYVEAHGTGTPLGDPIELNALYSVFCKEVEREHPLYVGSIKTNIGHLEGAASVASVIKVVCALQNRQIPRSLHFSEPSPHVDWASNSIEVANRRIDWPVNRLGRRIAGVSSFGMSGTNVHLILESYSDSEIDPVPDREPETGRAEVVTLSAHSPTSLQQSIEDCIGLIRRDDRLTLGGLAHALRSDRDVLKYRVGVVASFRDDLLQQLMDRKRALESGMPRSSRNQLAFVFTGQGAQYGGMGRELYQRFPAFRDVIDQCDEHFARMGEPSLTSVLWGDNQALIDNTRYTQPALFAVEYALARLWMSWGIRPEALIGHSIGEYAAACVAGVFDVEAAFRLIALRGRLMEQSTPPGKMCVVFASSLIVKALLADYAGEVEIAVDATPTTVVVAGRTEAVDAVATELGRRNIDTRFLNVSRAFHSPLMDPMLEAFREAAASIRYSPPTINLVSSVTGRFESSLFTQPDYWVDHVRKTVQFKRGMDQLVEAGVDGYLEVGPGKGTLSLARSCYQAVSAGQTATWLHSFDRNQDECVQLLGALAELYEAGAEIDWSAVEARQTSGRQGCRVTLPRYPLDRSSYWVCERVAADQPVSRRATRLPNEPEHTSLLGHEIDLPQLREQRFEARLGSAALQMLSEHRLGMQIVFPAAGFLAIAIQAARRLEHATVELRDVSFSNPLLLDKGRTVCLSTTVRESATARARFEIHSACDDARGRRREWVEHCTGELADAAQSPSSRQLGELRAVCTQPLPVEDFYGRFSAAGLNYSGAFRSVRTISRGRRTAIAEIRGNGQVGMLDQNPALLDCCLQTIAAALWDEDLQSLYLPLGVRRLWIDSRPHPDYLWCSVEVQQVAKLMTADLRLFDASGELCASIDGFELAPVDIAKFGSDQVVADRLLYDLVWDRLPAGSCDAARAETLECLLVAREATTVNEIARQLSHPGVTAYAPDAPATVDDYKSALEHYACKRPRSSERVVAYVWPGESEPDATRFASAYEDFRRFWKALDQVDWAGARVYVCMLTRAGQRIESFDRSVRPGHAAAWGLARSLMHESIDKRVLLIDLPHELGASTQCVLPCIEIGMREAEAQFAIRNDVILVPRMRERAPVRPVPCAIGVGTYLVTGGSGAIGTRIVEWLIGKGVQKILSLSRRLPDLGERQRLLALIGDGKTSLEFVAADVGSFESVASVIDREQSALKGVFHAAGLLDDGLLLAQEPAAIANVLASKVEGALNLHRCTAHLPLDLFVCFSSIVSCVGAPGQTAYAAANAYMDAVSLLRNEAGLPGHAINWGPWAGRGMVARLDDRQRARIEASGIREIDPDLAMTVFESLVAQRAGRSLVWQVDASLLQRHASSTGVGAMLQDLHGGRQRGAALHAEAPSQDYLKRLRALSRVDMEAEVQRHLLERLAQTLGTVAAKVDPQQPLISMGIDSLMAAQFRNMIREALAVELPFARLLEGATLREIAQVLVAKLRSDPIAPKADEPEPAQPRAAMTKRLDAVSVEATFDAELESGEV